MDEFHTLVGAGGGEGSVDASSVLKIALARGEAQCIGITGPQEYRELIARDVQLDHRFQQIDIFPPSRS
jgi:ATP-dependent Clp protease ATP-binding subunit ClpA